MRLRSWLASAVALWAWVGACSAVEPPREADWLFVGGRHFVQGAQRPDVTMALAVRGGVVVALGPEEGLAAQVGPRTRVADLEGRMLLPSFEDAHLHLDAGGAALSWPLLGEATSPDELLALLRVQARRLPRGAWLRGVGLREHITGRNFIDRLDEHFPSRPVSLLSRDGETLWRNNAARSAVSPPEPTRDEKLAHLRRAARHVNRFGITSVRTSPLLWPEASTLLDELTAAARGEDAPLTLEVTVMQDPSEGHASLRREPGSKLAWAHPFEISADSRPTGKRERPRLPLRSLEREGYRLRFGSDWPLAPLDPLAGIAAAVSRRDLDDRPERGWLPHERLNVAEAILGYTHRFLEVGMPADLVVLSHDLLTISDEQLATAKVEMTIFRGEVVYVSAGFAAELASSGARPSTKHRPSS